MYIWLLQKLPFVLQHWENVIVQILDSVILNYEMSTRKIPSKCFVCHCSFYCLKEKIAISICIEFFMKLYNLFCFNTMFTFCYIVFWKRCIIVVYGNSGLIQSFWPLFIACCRCWILFPNSKLIQEITFPFLHLSGKKWFFPCFFFFFPAVTKRTGQLLIFKCLLRVIQNYPSSRSLKISEI